LKCNITFYAFPLIIEGITVEVMKFIIANPKKIPKYVPQSSTEQYAIDTNAGKQLS